MNHLQPRDKDFRMLEPTANGSILFRNQRAPRDSKADPDDEKENDNAVENYKSVQLSEQFVKNFHLQGEKVVRPRYMHTIDAGHTSEICWIFTEYLRSLPQTECIGVLDHDIDDGDSQCRIKLDPSKPLFPLEDFLATAEAWNDNDALVFEDVEFSIADTEWTDATSVKYGHRALADSCELSVDYFGNSVEYYIELSFDFKTDHAAGTEIYIEHPVLKKLAEIYQQALAPEIVAESHGDSGEWKIENDDYEELTRFFDEDELARMKWICTPNVDVDIKQGVHLRDKEDQQGRMIVGKNADFGNWLDSVGEPTDEEDEKVDRLFTFTEGVKEELGKKMTVGKKQVDAIKIAGATNPLDVFSPETIKVWSAGFTNPRRFPFYKIFEQSYEINSSHAYNTGFVGADYDGTSFTEMQDATENRFTNTCLQMSDMLTSLAKKEHKLEEGHMVDAMKSILLQIEQNQLYFPGIKNIVISQYVVHDTNRNQIMDLTSENVQNVKLSGKDTRNIGLLNSDGFGSTWTSTLGVDGGGPAKALIAWTETEDGKKAYLAVAGQRVIVYNEDDTELEAKVVLVDNTGLDIVAVIEETQKKHG